MNMKAHSHHPWTWLIVMLTALLLTACGGGGGGDDATTGGTNTGGSLTGGTTGGSTTGGDTTGNPPPPAVTPPPAVALAISSTTPADSTTGVALNSMPSVTFNVKVDPATIVSLPSAFTIREIGNDAHHLPGSVVMNADGMTAVFMATENLAANAQYIGTVSTEVRSEDGTSLAQEHTWTFSTTSPAVGFTYPSAATTAPAINTKIVAAFNTDIDPLTIDSPAATSFTLRQAGPGGAAVAGVVTYDARTKAAVFAPTANLLPATAYTATITTDVRDMRGNALGSGATWTFTTGAQADTSKPSVLTVSPGSEVTGVRLDSEIKVTFSEAMDPSSITSQTFFVSDESYRHLSGRLVIDAENNVATFFPADSTANTRYHVVLTSEVKDLAGNTLDTGSNIEWRSYFETGAP